MKHTSYVVLAGMSLTVLTGASACGVVGAPIAPENVGVNPTIARQKMELRRQGEDQTVSTDQVSPGEIKGQDEELPPLRPVGTR